MEAAAARLCCRAVGVSAAHSAVINICVRDNQSTLLESETVYLQLLFRKVMRLKPPPDKQVVS